MKMLKINLAVFAAILGLGLALATAPSAKAVNAKFTTSWFAYNGSGSITDPSNYTEVSGSPDCVGTSNVCSIQATVGTGHKPVITQSLQNQINTAASSHTPSANVLLQD